VATFSILLVASIVRAGIVVVAANRFRATLSIRNVAIIFGTTVTVIANLESMLDNTVLASVERTRIMIIAIFRFVDAHPVCASIIGTGISVVAVHLFVFALSVLAGIYGTGVVVVAVLRAATNAGSTLADVILCAPIFVVARIAILYWGVRARSGGRTAVIHGTDVTIFAVRFTSTLSRLGTTRVIRTRVIIIALRHPVLAFSVAASTNFADSKLATSFLQDVGINAGSTLALNGFANLVWTIDRTTSNVLISFSKFRPIFIILVIMRYRHLDLHVQVTFVAIHGSGEGDALVELLLASVVAGRRHSRWKRLVGREFLQRNIVVNLLDSAAIVIFRKIHMKAKLFCSRSVRQSHSSNRGRVKL